jgi:hypothetical protein
MKLPKKAVLNISKSDLRNAGVQRFSGIITAF